MQFYPLSFKKRAYKDLKRRIRVTKVELYTRLIKYFLSNRNLDFFTRAKFHISLYKLRKDESMVRLHNRCVFSDRSKGVYRFFKLSRIVIRKLNSCGWLNGISKYNV